jgi:hypothetical protein
VTARELERKLAQRCKRCGVELTERDQTSHCEPHRLDLNARVARAKAKRRTAPMLPIWTAAAA